MTRRRSIAATLAGTLVISVMLSVSPASAGACSCGGLTDAEAFELADAAFLAEVDAIYPARANNSAIPEVTILRVSDVYKGTVDQLQGIVTPAGGSSCGVDFIPDEIYVVFTTNTSNFLDVKAGFQEVNLCNGTRRLGSDQLAVDTTARPPNDAGPPSFAAINDQLGTVRTSILPEAVILVAVLTAVLGLAAFFARRDRQPIPTANEDGE